MEDSWINRKFGSLRGGDIARALTVYRQLEVEAQEFIEEDLKRLAEFEVKPIPYIPAWAELYEQPFRKVLAYAMKQVGMVDTIKSVVKAENPNVAFIDIMKLELDTDDFAPEDIPTFFGLWVAILANLDAIQNYSQTMSDLIADLDKPDRCITSLCKALRIDSTVVGLPQVARLYFVTQITENKAAENEIIRALRGSPHKKLVPHRELRWVEYLLREVGAFESCRFEEIHDLVVNGLCVYKPDGDKGDSLKALQKLFTTWQKSAGTQNPGFR